MKFFKKRRLRKAAKELSKNDSTLSKIELVNYFSRIIPNSLDSIFYESTLISGFQFVDGCDGQLNTQRGTYVDSYIQVKILKTSSGFGLCHKYQGGRLQILFQNSLVLDIVEYKNNEERCIRRLYKHIKAGDWFLYFIRIYQTKCVSTTRSIIEGISF